MTATSGDDDRASVIGASEELTKTIATALGNAHAQKRMKDACRLRAAKDFVGAVHAVRAAAKLFDNMGLVARAAAALAEANRTEAEALVLESETLYEDGAFEAILHRLQRAETMFLTNACTEEEQSVIEPSLLSCDGHAIAGIDGIDGSSGEDNNDPILAPEGPRRDIDDLNRFRSRVEGDKVMLGVEPALAARDYDLALHLMVEADSHYANTIRDGIEGGRWATSATLRDGNKGAAVGLPPKEAILKRASQDGERLRKEAAHAIQKEKDPIKATELLSAAEACIAWAGGDPVAAGVATVAKDINVFQSRASGDEICRELIHVLLKKDFERANVMLQEALDRYRQVGIPCIACHTPTLIIVCYHRRLISPLVTRSVPLCR